MIKALLKIRLRGLFHSMSQRAGKKRSTGMTVLLGLLFLYAGGAFCVLFGMMFFSLTPYCDAGLNWLYFTIAYTMALALSIFGSVFTAQSQLYDAKDNELLLSMPIPPRLILLSRMAVLFGLNLLFSVLVLAPAGVVYGMYTEFTALGLVSFLLCGLTVPLVALALECFLGWLLHLLLSRLNNRAAISFLFMILFLAVYFGIYSQAGKLMETMINNADVIAGVFRIWIWPLYAMGIAAAGQILYLPVCLLIAGGIFALAYWILAATFLKSVTDRRGSRRKIKKIGKMQAGSAGKALRFKELRRFLTSPIYLTNMGLGPVMTAAAAVAGIIFRKEILEFFRLFPNGDALRPAGIALVLGLLAGMSCISAPSVSLEGKNLWILKSMPLTGRQVLDAKLGFHCLLTIPVTALAGAVLAVALGCGLWGTLLAVFLPCLACLLCGILGLIFNLLFPKFDWINPAGPCKQSAAVMLTMFLMWGAVLIPLFLYIFLSPLLGAIGCLLLFAVLLSLLNGGLLLCLRTWGAKRFESFE